MNLLLFRKIRFSAPIQIRAFLKHYLGGLYARADQHHIFLFGSGLAFSLFLCIVPFVLIIFSILGNILAAKSVEQQVISFINTVIPYQEYADYARTIIFSRIAEFIEYKTLAGLIGGVGLLFAASGLFSSMRTILNKVFVVEEDKTGVVGKLRDLAMVLFVVISILMATIVLPALDVLIKVVHSWSIFNYYELSRFQGFSLAIISFLMIFLMFFGFYSFIPYAKIGRKIPAVSALWATIFWEIAKYLFGYYLYNVASLDKIYGTYALVVVLAFWIYYSSVLFIVGAEIGQLYRERLALKKVSTSKQKPRSRKS
jgi:membrane protein